MISNTERKDIPEGVVANFVCLLPESMIPSCNLRLRPVLIARVADRGLAAVVLAGDWQVPSFPTVAGGEAAKGAVVEMVDHAEGFKIGPGAERFRAHPAISIDPFPELSPPNLAESIQTGHPF